MIKNPNLELLVKNSAPRKSGSKINAARYTDGFIVTGKSKEILETVVLPAIQKFMAERGLELFFPEKTRITHIHEGFDFLGVHIRKYKDKLLTKLSRKSQQALRDKIEEKVKKLAQAPQETVIQFLNPILRGWARRRHPNKSATWVKDRYFQQIDNCSWTFAEMKTKDGEPLILFKMASVPFVRHVKIRGAAHPFDPKWKKYLKDKKLNHAKKTARYNQYAVEMLEPCAG